MSLRKKSVHAIFWSLLTQFCVAAIAFGIEISLTRMLNPVDFGLIGMIMFFMIVGQALIDSGMTSSLIRSKDPDSTDYSTVFFVNLVFSLVLYALFYLTAPLISTFYDEPDLHVLIRIYMFGLITAALAAVQHTRMVKELKYKELAKIQIIARIAGGTTGICLAYLGYGVWSLVFMNIVQQVVLVVQYWLAIKWYPIWSHFDRKRLGLHFSYGYKLGLSSLIEAAFSNIYYLVIGKFFSPVILGYYTRAAQLRQMPINTITQALNSVTFPIFSSLQDETEKLKIAYTKLMQQVIFWLAPLLLGGAVLAEPLFTVLFTAKWLPAVPYFQLLCIQGILFPINIYNLNVLKVFGRSDLYLKVEIIKKSLVVVMIIIALPYGIFALLIGHLITSLSGFLINSYYSARFINYPARDQARDILPILATAAIMAIAVLMLNIYLPESYSALTRLILGCGFGAVFYFLSAKYLNLDAYRDFWMITKDLKGLTVSK